MAYRNSLKDSASIAKELNVTTILEGGVQRAIELNDNNANAYAAYGSLLTSQMNDTAQGIKLIQKSVDLDPKNPRFRKILAESLVQ